jgi:hypothetical protein
VSAQTPIPVPIPAVCVPLGIALGLALLTSLAHWQRDFIAGELGLGLQTRSFAAEWEGERVSGDVRDANALAARLAALRRDERRSVLWLGASQLHAINRAGPEAKLAVWYAQQRAQQRGSPLAYTQLSLPNAGPLELLAVYQAFRQPRMRPDRLVLAFTYDDLNETRLRADVLALLDRTRAPAGSDGASPLLARARRESQRALEAPAAAPIARSATSGTPQAWLEQRLVAGLERLWPAYAARDTLRSAGIAAWKLPLTRLVFRLRGRPVQRVEPAAESISEAALRELAAQTRSDGVALLVYQAPHRPASAERFYHDRSAYDTFHARLGALAEREGFDFLDLEALVPAEVYGLTNQYLPDVFHFREEGHRRLGRAIDAWLEAQGPTGVGTAPLQLGAS